MNNLLINQLADLNNMFDEVKNADPSEFGGYEQLPDGIYNAHVHDVELKESKSGKPMVVLAFHINSAESGADVYGTQHNKYLMLAGNDQKQLQRNLNAYSLDMQKLGADVSQGLTHTFEQFPSLLGKEVLLKLETTTSKTTGKSFTNTSFELN